MKRLLSKTLVAISFVGLIACGGEAADGGDAAAGDTAVDSMATTDADTTSTAQDAADGLLDPESATRDQLTAIPGIDAALADSLIAARPFTDMTEVDSILATSLDEAQREEVYRRLWKRIDLNTASDEEILLIPGIGERMLGEFKEYRPYRAIEQFRREIGKYVDEEEVARLEQYVEIR